LYRESTMSKFFTMKLKIIILPALASILLLTVLCVECVYMKKSRNLSEKAISTHLPAWETGINMRNTLVSFHHSIGQAVLDGKQSDLTNVQTQLDHFLALIDDAQKRSLIPAEELDPIRKNFNNYYKLYQDAGLGQPGKHISVQASMAESSYNATYDAIETAITQSNATLSSGLTHLDQTSDSMGDALTWLIIIAIVILFGFTYNIVQSVTRPIKKLAKITSRIAEGDLLVEVERSDGRDELAELINGFNIMVENLHVLTQEVKDGTQGLAAAAGQISASVTEISSAAAETASAASQTSTTVEEVRQTALDSNRKAKMVSENAHEAVEISQTGEDAVNLSIEGMHRIEEQMESIAGSIMKLSEHGQAIGDIIATVEDIAEQSRLLAVNASIEAVKAGEHGKGFSVVAQEVQNLAEQSKESTARVRSILDDIQKATSEAVMKTEQGSKAVKAGVKQSQESGEAIARLAESVEQAAQATTQISVSSQEQVVGMDQVVSAMESIKTASAQHVDATRQVELAAQELHKLGQRLSELMNRYQLN